MDQQWISNGLAMDWQWISNGLAINGLAMDQQWIRDGLAMDQRWISDGLASFLVKKPMKYSKDDPDGLAMDQRWISDGLEMEENFEKNMKIWKKHLKIYKI